MKRNFLVHHLNDGHSSPEDIMFASSCPCCGITLLPTPLYAVCIDYEDEDDNIIYLLNYCENCNECFISSHPFDPYNDYSYSFGSSSPAKAVDCSFSSAISELSSNFVKIYKQSYKAEVLGLDAICGMGYRKAIEFLIKDYILYKDPSLKDSVAKLQLMPCIKNYIHDERLVTLACASAWLGNDETHYEKRHPDYDLNNLRIFINAFVTFVDADLAYESAKQLVSK